MSANNKEQWARADCLTLTVLSFIAFIFMAALSGITYVSDHYNINLPEVNFTSNGESVSLYCYNLYSGISSTSSKCRASACVYGQCVVYDSNDGHGNKSYREVPIDLEPGFNQTKLESVDQIQDVSVKALTRSCIEETSRIPSWVVAIPLIICGLSVVLCLTSPDNSL